MSTISRIRQLRRKYVKKTGKHTLRLLDRFLVRQSLIGDKPFFDKTLFPWTPALENNWRAMRTELDQVLLLREHLQSFHELSPDQQRISKGNNWKTFPFYGFGNPLTENCQRCPETARALAQIPGLQNAWFSILAPGYHIPAHRGVFKGVVRCHLALLVPEKRERCVIRVANEIHPWEEGQCMFLDDTFDHEVWNNTDQERVVLFIDFKRPLRLPGRLLNQMLLRAIQLTAYVKDARKSQAAWEERFASIWKRNSIPTNTNNRI